MFQNLQAFGFEIDNVRLLLQHANGTTAKDTTVTFAPGDTVVVIQLSVNLDASTEQLKANIELRDGQSVLFSGTQSITASTSGVNTPPPPIPVTYSGPGAKAATLVLSPKDTILTPGDTIAFRPTAKDNAGQAVPDLALVWSVKDETRGTVDARGVFKSNPGRGSTYVIARLLTGVKDSAKVNMVPPAAKLIVVSGGGQSGVVGKAVAQNVVVEAQATDNLPVPQTRLSLRVAGGDGAVSITSAVTDDNGRAAFGITLGKTAGQNAVEVSAVGVPSLVVSATGIADKASKLGLTRQPSATVASGAALAIQPRLQVQDAFGNAVAAENVQIGSKLTDASTGRSLGGTLTAKSNAAGVIEFTDLKISGPPGTSTITFGQDTLGTAVSNDVVVSKGPAAFLVLQGEPSVTHVAGVAPANPPAIKVTDAGGNGIGDVAVRVVVRRLGASPVTIRDTTMLTDPDGRIGFGRLPIATVAGSYDVTSSSPGLSGSPIVGSLTVMPAAAAKLRLTTIPATSIQSGSPFAPQPVVTVQDAFGNTVTSSTATISAGITAANSLTGTTSKAAVNGIAAFENLGVTGPIGSAKVGFTSTGLAPDSVPLTVTSSGPTQIQIVQGEGLGLLKGGSVNTSVRVKDAGGNNLAGVTVHFAAQTGAGSVASADVVTGTDGVAMTSWQVGTSGVQLMRATVGTLGVDFHAYIAEKLKVIQEPAANPQSGIEFTTQTRVQLLDAQDHVVPLAGQVIHAGILYNTASENTIRFANHDTAALTDAQGIATFEHTNIEGHKGEPFTLLFERWITDHADPGVTAVQTQSLTLREGPARVIYSMTSRSRFSTTDVSPSFTFVVSDGFNRIPGVAVEFSLQRATSDCTLSSPTSVTTDANGQAVANIAAGTKMHSTCMIMGQFTPPPPPGCPTCGAPIVAWTGFYLVPDGWSLWTGGVDQRWDNAQNWWNGVVPTEANDVFVPATAFLDNPPKLAAAQSVRALIVESGNAIDLNGQTLSVFDNITANGPILSNAPSGGRTVLRGQFNKTATGTILGLLEIGDNTSCNDATISYSAVGLLTDSLIVNCQLNVNSAANSALFVESWMKVMGGAPVGGYLTQTDGTIHIGTDAFFLGRATLSGGTMFVGGNLTHVGDGVTDAAFNASSGHALILSGAAGSGDTLRVTWSNASTSSRLGRVVMTSATDKGFTFASNNPTGSNPLLLAGLQVSAGTKLRVPPSFSLTIDGSGLGLVVQSDNAGTNGVVTNDGFINVLRGSGGNCPVPNPGIITGPYFCTAP